METRDAGARWDELAEYFTLERRGGALMARMHTGGGPAAYSLGLHRAWGRLWQSVAADSSAEVVILTGTADAWIAGADPELLAGPPFHQWPSQAVDDLHRDRLRMVESLVFGVDVPTIGVVNGPGLHTELALFCDLTVCVPNTVFFDAHFSAGQVPGDGTFLAMQALLGDKRAAFHLYTGQPLGAEQARELGLINEVVPAARACDRGWALAELMTRQSSAVRRLTHALVQRPMRRRLVDDYGLGISYGLLASLIDKT